MVSLIKDTFWNARLVQINLNEIKWLFQFFNYVGSRDKVARSEFIVHAYWIHWIQFTSNCSADKRRKETFCKTLRYCKIALCLAKKPRIYISSQIFFDDLELKLAQRLKHLTFAKLSGFQEYRKEKRLVGHKAHLSFSSKTAISCFLDW